LQAAADSILSGIKRATKKGKDGKSRKSGGGKDDAPKKEK